MSIDGLVKNYPDLASILPLPVREMPYLQFRHDDAACGVRAGSIVANVAEVVVNWIEENVA